MSWQNVPGRNKISEWPGWGGRCAEGHDPFTFPVPDRPPQPWQKHTFQMRSQDNPGLKVFVLFPLEQFPLLLGKYWGLYEKNNNHF